MLTDIEWEFSNTADKPFWYRQESDLIIMTANPEALEKAGIPPEEMPERAVLKRDQAGVYQEGFIPDIEIIVKECSPYRVSNSWGKLYGEAGLYGVADTVDQVLTAARILIEDNGIPFLECLDIDHPKRMFVISYVIINKADNPDWRWHKNGHYIGTQKPTCEHIGDEEIIQSVISYQIHELILK